MIRVIVDLRKPEFNAKRNRELNAVCRKADEKGGDSLSSKDLEKGFKWLLDFQKGIYR